VEFVEQVERQLEVLAEDAIGRGLLGQVEIARRGPERRNDALTQWPAR
jgi:hypothetical protein